MAMDCCDILTDVEERLITAKRALLTYAQEASGQPGEGYFLSKAEGIGVALDYLRGYNRGK